MKGICAAVFDMRRPVRVQKEEQQNDSHLRSAQKLIAPILIINLWLSVIPKELREDIYCSDEFEFLVSFHSAGER